MELQYNFERTIQLWKSKLYVMSIAWITDEGLEKREKWCVLTLYNVWGIDVPSWTETPSCQIGDESERRRKPSSCLIHGRSIMPSYDYSWAFKCKSQRGRRQIGTQTPHRRLINWWRSFRLPFLFDNSRKSKCIARAVAFDEPSSCRKC